MPVPRIIFSAAVVAILTALPVWSQTVADSLVGQLHNQGFNQVDVFRTWLGRIRIEAEGGGMHREIVVNPRTGEILRDYLRSDDGSNSVGLFSAGPDTSDPGTSDDGGSQEASFDDSSSSDDGGDSDSGGGGDDGGDDGGDHGDDDGGDDD